MSGRRVVVLARAGAARDQSQAAVLQAEAEVVATMDPIETSEAEVRAATPDALLVVLDPVTEQALGNLEDLFSDPTLEVLFDDADVAAKRSGWDLARWSRHLAAKLQGHGNVLPAPPTKEPTAKGFASEAAEIALSMALLTSVDEVPVQAPKIDGAVIVVAGIGGPDAVRQLLGGLPSTFPRAVLLRQHIEGGQYDRLVRQLQRATPLSVMLAQAGETLRTGMVYVIPDGLDVQAGNHGGVFVEANGEPQFAALPRADSAMLLLSGASASQVDVALSMRYGGSQVYGQAPENSFDPSASALLVARGGETRSLAELTRLLIERWPG